NLGVTQAGRIEYALAGGRINTDFIDNSAGVDCSDKEVNIKIALASARRAGRLAEADRPALLAGMTDAVAELVLDDNRQQALGLSVAQGGGVAAVPAYLRLIDQLEEAGQLDRATEGLADAETFTRRAAGHDDGQDGRGLTRPELAVLLSSAKLALQAALEAAPLLDDPELTPLFAPLLAAAFPEAMRRGFAADIAGHQLRREILATGIANRVVNRLGLLAPFELAEEEGVGLADVAAACLAAEALFGMAPLWRAIDTGVMPEAARIALMGAAAAGLRGHMSELLRAEPAAPMALASALGPTIAELADERESQQEPAARAQSAARLAALTDAGAPVDLAISVNRLADMAGAVGLAYLAHGRRCHLPALAQAFARLGTALDLDWAEAAAARLAPADPWERLLAGGLARDFQQMRLARLARLAEGDPLGEVERWLAAHEPAAERLRLLAARARQAPRLSPAMLAQIARQARILLAP
ncbi:MAG TPA: NAD-glutamate dehydrogenase domain-containing protein, partial [Novosphingobium sp.]|nr:NAD-glutamate dehydrogenase domain-containing protein [Novosphingobium sp.]